MDEEDDPFDERQLLRKEGIEDYGHESYRNNQQSTMPPLGLIAWVIYCNKADEHVRNCVGAARNARMPAEDADPAGHIAQEPLAAGRCEFRDPMVLSSRRWSPVEANT